MSDHFSEKRERLVEQELRVQGIECPRVLKAMRTVPREKFVPQDVQDVAYRNAPLPIEEGQTISQPLIVALMAEALELTGSERVLEIGTGSGYAAAVLAELAGEVYTVERFGWLAETAETRLKALGYHNVHVLLGDGTLGWPDHAPYDAIVVAAGGPDVPETLTRQLKVGGRLVIPVGEQKHLQTLVRVTRTGQDEFETEDLGNVRFVPLVGQEGWDTGDEEDELPVSPKTGKRYSNMSLPELIREAAESFESVDEADLSGVLERIGDSRLVLIGEGTHGTSEFYRMRARMTESLIEQKGFDFVAVEADWPDAGRINDYVTNGRSGEARKWNAFDRFPEWMWRNHEVLDFVEWLREFNLKRKDKHRRVNWYGLDLYSLFTSIRVVLDYLEKVDPECAELARERYSCLTAWEPDPQSYGRAAVLGQYRSCEEDVVHMLQDLLTRQMEYARYDGEYFMDAALNARLIANAEKYYRVMYQGGDDSWNLRDQHMFETLESLLDFHGAGSKAVVWAHNSHLGDDAATEMGRSGQINLGHLCRKRFGDSAYLIGQLTDRGTVAAAPFWGELMERMQVRPSHEESYERVLHDAGLKQAFLPLKTTELPGFQERVGTSRLERAIGVVYRPHTEVQSHYFEVSLTDQFDELVWFDESTAIHPLDAASMNFDPDRHPFSLID